MKMKKTVFLALTVLSVLLMGSKCNRDPQGNVINDAPLLQDDEPPAGTPVGEDNTGALEADAAADPGPESLDWLEDMTVDEFTEAIDQEMINLDEAEKQTIIGALAGMSAEELNAAIEKVMNNLNNDEKGKFIAWLKAHYLIYQNATVDNWQLPTRFNKPPSMEWPAGIPEPKQGSVYIFTQGGDVTQITLVNLTGDTYQDWAGLFTEEWAISQGMIEFFDAEKEKGSEYVGLNTEYNLGPDSKTTVELFSEAGRTGEGVPQTRIFGAEDLTKWLELAYGQNMAILTFNGDFGE